MPWQRGNGKVRSKFVNHNGAKLVDVCQQTYRGTEQKGSRQTTDRAAQRLSPCQQTRWGRM